MKSVTSEPLVASATPAQSSPAIPQQVSAALQRLMDEVRFEETNGSSAAVAYDRAHNRHNRS